MLHLYIMHLALLVIAGIILHHTVSAPVFHVLVASIKIKRGNLSAKLCLAVITPFLLDIVHMMRVLVVNISLVLAV